MNWSRLIKGNGIKMEEGGGWMCCKGKGGNKGEEGGWREYKSIINFVSKGEGFNL